VRDMPKPKRSHHEGGKGGEGPQCFDLIKQIGGNWAVCKETPSQKIVGGGGAMLDFTETLGQRQIPSKKTHPSLRLGERPLKKNQSTSLDNS